VALAVGAILAAPALLAALAPLLAGLAAALPERWPPRPAALALVAARGALTGLAPGATDVGAGLQPVLGTILGIAGLAELAWFGLEAAGRSMTPLVPGVAGS
jgi:hypothetical protein